MKQGKEKKQPMRDLYQIPSEIMHLEELIEASANRWDSTEETNNIIGNYMAGACKGIENAADDICALIVSMESRAFERKKEAMRMIELARAGSGDAKTLKGWLRTAMESSGAKKIEGARFKMTVCRMGGKRPLIIEDESAVPENFKQAKWQTDKEKIRKFLDKEPLSWAHLGDRGTYLRIA